MHKITRRTMLAASAAFAAAPALAQGTLLQGGVVIVVLDQPSNAPHQVVYTQCR